MVARNSRPSDDVRMLILQYLYDRNQSATSARGKHGAAVKIGMMRKELKEAHGLTVQDVVGNLRYLISQKWVEEQIQDRVVPMNGGRWIPSGTPFYAITAAGIDKIDGEGVFTPRDRFAGIQINATGQSTVTMGDGNQINVKYESQGKLLAELGNAIKLSTEIDEKRKMDAIADIDSIQAQLARSTPNSDAIKSIWKGIEPLSKIVTISSAVISAGKRLLDVLS